MPLPSTPRRVTHCAVWLFVIVVTYCAANPVAHADRSDQLPWDSVGIIEGDDIVVSGSVSVDVVNGKSRTILRNGSDIRVRSGTARIDLTEGGQISVCGPARFSLLKSGTAVTLALNSGTVHAHIEREPTLTIYTALIQAHPISIGDGPQDVLVGFHSTDEMCIRANRGAVRVEQQLTGQSVVVPQTGDIVLANGQVESLRTGAGQCTCEIEIAKAGPAVRPQSSQAANGDGGSQNALEANVDLPVLQPEKSAAKEEPIYTVYMPPLVYDANAKVQPEFDPSMIVLVRRVRVRPALIFQGRVEGEAAAAAPAPARVAQAGVAGTPATPPKPATRANNSFADRVRNFVRKIWSP